MGFLRPEIRKSLEKRLENLGCPKGMQERVCNIPEGAHDTYLWAHLRVCEDNLKEYGNPLFVKLSTLVICAIRDEAHARNMMDSDFPKSRKLETVVEVIAASQNADNTKH